MNKQLREQGWQTLSFRRSTAVIDELEDRRRRGFEGDMRRSFTFRS
jgi:hypothetical protein